MSNEGQRGVAVLCVLLVAFAAVSGPVTAVTESSEKITDSDSLRPPMVDAPNVTIDDATPSNVTVSYNLTGEVAKGDLDVVLTSPKGVVATNASRPAAGNATFTIPADEFGGGTFQYVVYGWNNSSSEAIRGSFASGLMNVTSNTSVTSFDVNQTEVVADEDVRVNATVTNPSSTAENVTLGPYYAEYETNYLGNRLGRTIEVANNSTRNVSFVANISRGGSYDVWVNNLTATTVNVTEPTPLRNANTSATAVNVTSDTALVAEDSTVNVTLNNSGPVDETVNVSLPSYNQRHDFATTSHVTSVNASETKTVSVSVNYSTYGDWQTAVGDTSDSVMVLESGTNIVFDERQLTANETVVADEPQSFYVEAVNYGDTTGTSTLNFTYDNGTQIDNETVTLAPGNATGIPFQHTFGSTGEYGLVYEDDGEPFSQNLTVRPNPVVATNLTVVGGTEPSGTVNASASYDANGLTVKAVNASGSGELATEGVDGTTQFRLNVTVQNLTTRLFVGTARNASWERIPINDTHTTYVFAGTPAEQQFRRDAPDLDSWASNSTMQATFARDQTFSFTGFQLESAPTDHQERLNGTLIATDAQTFGTPEYVNRSGEDPKFTIELAAPHYEAEEVNGSKVVNDGFYAAQLPSQLVDQWNVSDPESELNAVYQGNEEAFSASSLPDGGLAVSLDIHYSAGSVSVSPSSSGSTDGSTDDSTDTTTDDSTDSTSDASDPVDFDEEDGEEAIAASESPDQRVVEAANESDGDNPVTIENVSAGTNVTVDFEAGSENESTNETESEDADEAADVNESAPPASVETVNVSVASDASFTMNVSSSASAPASAANRSLPDGTDASAYVSVEHDGLTNADIDGASLTLNVSKSRFDSAADAANATVLRLHDGEWQHLDTTLAGATSDSYRFRADSPGLSVFAVAEPDPELTVTDARIDAADATVGDTVTVTASVTNDGGSGEATAALTFDGDSVATTQLSLEANETTTVTFEHELASAGTVDVAVENATAGSLAVAQQTETTTVSATSAEPTSSTDTNTPGFGVLVAVLALLAAAGIRVRD